MITAMDVSAKDFNLILLQSFKRRKSACFNDFNVGKSVSK